MGHNSLSRRQALQISFALSAGVALTACTPRSPSPTASGSSQPAGPQRIFSFAQAAPIVSLDPARTQRIESTRITAQVLEPLIAADPNTGEPIPGVAEQWELSDDRLTYTFTLAQGLTFSEGTQLTAQTLADNFKRWKSLGALPRTRLSQPYHQLFSAAEDSTIPHAEALVRSWKADAEHTFSVTLSRPSAAFLKALTQPALGIVLPEIIGDDGYLTADPVGTGAFRLESWEADNASLGLNPHFHAEIPEIDGLKFITLADPEKRFYSLLKETVDAYDQVALKDYVQLARDGLAVQSRDPYAISYININLSHPAFADALTRRALAQAIDRGRISGDYYPQGTSPAADFLPALFQLKDEEREDFFRYDPAAAKALLKQSTYGNEPIDFYYPVSASLAALPSPEGIYSVVSANLTAAGFNIVPKPYRWDNKAAEDIPTGHPDYGLELTGFMGAFRDPTAFLGRVLAPAATAPAEISEEDSENESASPSPSASESSAEATRVAVSFPQLLEDIRQADTLEEIADRRSAYRAINEAIAQFIPAVPLCYPVSGITVGKRVRAYSVNATGIDSFSEIQLWDA